MFLKLNTLDEGLAVFSTEMVLFLPCCPCTQDIIIKLIPVLNFIVCHYNMHPSADIALRKLF